MSPISPTGNLPEQGTVAVEKIWDMGMGVWGPGCKSSVQLSLSSVSSPCDNIDGEPSGAEIGTRYRGVNEELIIGAVFGRYITGTLDTGIPHPSQYITYSQDTR